MKIALDDFFESKVRHSSIYTQPILSKQFFFNEEDHQNLNVKLHEAFFSNFKTTFSYKFFTPTKYFPPWLRCKVEKTFSMCPIVEEILKIEKAADLFEKVVQKTSCIELFLDLLDIRVCCSYSHKIVQQMAIGPAIWLMALNECKHYYPIANFSLPQVLRSLFRYNFSQDYLRLRTYFIYAENIPYSYVDRYLMVHRNVKTRTDIDIVYATPHRINFFLPRILSVGIVYSGDLFFRARRTSSR